MLVGECANSVPAFWQSAGLQQAVPHALLHLYAAQPIRHQRLTLHHAFIAMTKHCPVDAAAPWLAESVGTLVTFWPQRLGGMWAEMGAKQSGQVGGAKSKQTEDEIVQEVRSARFRASALVIGVLVAVC